MMQFMRMAGAKLGEHLAKDSVKKFARDAAVGAALEAGVGIGVEQLLPRALGQQPQASLGESVLRQGASAAIGSPIATALSKAGVPGSVAQFGGTLVGQPIGQAVAQGILPGHQQYPLGIDPEPTEASHAHYGQLMAKQQMEAMAERERYNNMINLALARNYNPPSFIHHQSSGTSPQDTAMNIVKAGFSAPSYG